MTNVDRGDAPASVSVWHFVGATFIFTMPTLLFRDLALWGRIAVVVLGFAVMVAGFVQLRRELNAKSRTRASGEGSGGPVPHDPTRDGSAPAPADRPGSPEGTDAPEAPPSGPPSR